MKLLSHFSARDLILITSIAALGIAVKPMVKPFTDFIATPFGIPGGSLAGGFYMMWLSLAVCIVNKKYTGTVFGILQAVLVLLVGMAGKQGVFSLVSYPLPGLVADAAYRLHHRPDLLSCHLLLCTLANITGSLVTGWFFFHLPPLMIFVNILLATASGIMGGYLSFAVFRALGKQRIIV